MTHPYGALISAEAKRAEEDLAAARSRGLTIVTTTTGMVTLLAALTTFAGSKTEDEVGISGLPLALLGVALAFFVAAAAISLYANRARTIDRANGQALAERTERDKWYGETPDGKPDTEDMERVAARITVAYLRSVRTVADDAANSVNKAILSLIIGLGFASASVILVLKDL